MKLIIISGRSGAGKSIALNLLEDLGYYCIENLPIDLLAELKEKLDKNYDYVAVSIDARNIGNDPKHLTSIIQKLKESYNHVEILFLDANDDILIKRFSETRRKHPLTNQDISLKKALQIEQTVLKSLIDYVDLHIDTSYLNIHDLRKIISDRIKKEDSNLSVLFQSFGYKNGIPLDTDFVFDVRCLPNPHWEKQLRHQTGLDEEVIHFLEEFPQVISMYDMIKKFVEKWIPAFEAENRKYLTISIGCTGGQHRSTYFAENLGQYFLKHFKNISIRHRDIDEVIS